MTRDGELTLFAKKVLIVVAFGIALAMLWVAREVLLLIFIAAIIAAGISPVVKRLRVAVRFRFHRNIRRGTAVVLVYVPFVVIVTVLAIIALPSFLAETRTLVTQLPSLLERNVVAPLERWLPMVGVRAQLRSGLQMAAGHVVGVVRGTATVFASLIALLFMIVYMLIDGERLLNLFLLLFHPDVRAEQQQLMTRIGRRMTSWLAGQLILSLMMGFAVFVTLLILRLPYALPLALLATAGEVVPIIGPIVATTPALAIAILHSRWQFWSLLIVVIVLQKIENLLIVPRVMSRRVQISPLAVFIAFMVGGALLGIIGALLAVPVAAIVQVAFDGVFVRRRERRQNAVRPGTLIRRG